MLGRRLAARMRATPERWFDAARMLGIGVVSALGQRIVDMPSGYFGATSQATTFGIVYAVAVLLGSLACGFAAVIGHRWTRGLFTVLTLAAVAVFLPALGSDVAVAASIVGWQLGMLASLLAGTRASARRAHRSDAEPMRRVAVHLLLLSLFTTTLIVGFRATQNLAVELVCLLLDAVAIACISLSLRRAGQARRGRRVLGGAGLVLMVLALLSLIPMSAPLQVRLELVLALLGVVQAGLLLLALREPGHSRHTQRIHGLR